jgi:hypothetical protein
MDTSQTGSAARVGRTAPPPPEPTPTPRFPGPPGELSSLQARLEAARDAGDEEAEARLSTVLARALARRGIEVREMLRLGERAFALSGDGALASELSSWWSGVGEPARAAAILQRVESRAQPDDRGALWMRIGVLAARAGKAEDAAHAFEVALQSAPHDALPAELLGTLHGWGAVSGDIGARAFQEAANRHFSAADPTSAFENCIRAFEACPSDPVAAERLAAALEERGRFGAAEEVLREHALRGSAAHRAAVHERRFARLVREGDLYAALGAALDAELDAALDAERLSDLLAGPADAPVRDAEAVFVHFASQDEAAREWLVAALDAAVFAWGAAEVQSLRSQLAARYPSEVRRVQLPPEMALGVEEMQRRTAQLREQLLRLGDAPQQSLRQELGRLLIAQGAWGAARDVLAPLLAPGAEGSLEVACLAAVTAVRAADPELRARALLFVARQARGRFRAVVASVASESLLELGLLADARGAAELAVEADPTWQRGIAAQALVAQRDPDASAAVLLERSLAVVLARVQACRVLADSSERRGALRLALTWTQRQLSQRPGDPELAKELLRRAAAAGDGERLADALAWLLSQPIPIAHLVHAAADSLRALVELSREHAPELARRVLDVMGPRAEPVREAILHVARVCELPELEAQVLERWLVTAPAEARPGALVELSRLRATTGNPMAAARALRRALRLGAPPAEVAERLNALAGQTDPDGVLASLEARAELYRPEFGSGELDPEARAQAAATLRELGAARWELSGDPKGAAAVWAAGLGDELVTPEQLARDLSTFGGAEVATSELERIALEVTAPALAGRLLGLAARAALEAHRPEDAFRLARAALARHPANTDVLTIAESSATSRDVDELVALYRTLAEATLGRYGERAVHYRAARQLEKRGRHELAFHHAMAAFEAVPAEGVAFVLMARLADRAGASEQVVGALERVASRAPDDASRVLWLARAAALADTSDTGRRQRIDVLLRALAVRPDAPTLATLVEAIRQLVEVCPEESEIVQLRFERALGVLLPKAGGMEGSLFGVRAARASLELFGSDELALRCLRRATECDCDIQQFAELRPYAERLAAAAGAREFVAWCAERAGRRIVSLGRPLAELAAAMAETLGEAKARAQLLARAALESPEDSELVRLAQRLARELDDPELLASVEKILPADDRARQVLEQAAGASVDQALDLLLEVELDPLSPELRRQVYAALGQRQEEIGRLQDAEASFRALLSLDADDVIALEGLGRAAERRGDSEELARLLLRRAECSSDPAQVVALRVRRAEVLEQPLGRVEEARQELERVLSETGDRADVLQALAALYARGGSPSRAATLWSRAARAAEDPAERTRFSLYAAEAHMEAGQFDAARRLTESRAPEPSLPAWVDLRVRLARQSGDRRALVAALAELAELRADDAAEASAALRDAAQAAEELGERPRAAELASRAAELAPDVAEIQLLARRLEYLERGAGNAEQAARTVAQLRGLGERLTHRQIELRAFLLAEALDVVEGGGAGRRELDKAVERVGSRALVAVGLAERLEDDPRRALQLLDAALGSDLHGLRGEGQVLIRAGRVARALGELDRAQAYLSAVAHEDPRHVEAAAELREIAAERGRVERDAQARLEKEAKARAEREAAETKARAERAESEAKARAEAERQAAAAKLQKERAESEAKARAEAERQAAAAKLQKEREAAEAKARADREAAELKAQKEREAAEAEARAAARAAEAERKAAEEKARADAEAEAVRARAEAEARAQREQAEREQAQREQAERAQAEAQPAPGSSQRPRGRRLSSGSMASVRERDLVAAFENGDALAGRTLLELLAGDAARSHDRLVIAERLTTLLPGDEWTLRQLVQAAESERNAPLAAAVRHVLGTFGVVPFEVAPEVGKLREQPDEVRKMLTGDLQCAGVEAAAIVWDNVPNLFKQEPSAYGITGLERVAAGPLTPLSRLYADAVRLFGVGRVPVFQRRGAEAITLSVALLSPPALLVSGEIEDGSSELAFHFGAMILATTPELALLFGAEPPRVRLLLAALLAAFGPPSAARPSPEVTRLAASLWEFLPPRGQRRLSQLCAHPEQFAYDRVTAAARQVLRRAGLVLCADLATAVVAACEEERLAPPRTLTELGECARHSAAVADLLRLAVSPAYAEVRWSAA